jgi:hypothetical protein
VYYSACKTVIQLGTCKRASQSSPDKFGGSCEEFQNAEKSSSRNSLTSSVKLAEAKSCIRRSQRRKALKKRNEDPLVQAAAGLSEFIALLKAKKNGV